jgi:hypothetical protein
MLQFDRAVTLRDHCHQPRHGAKPTVPAASDRFRPPISGLPEIGTIDAQVG